MDSGACNGTLRMSIIEAVKLISFIPMSGDLRSPKEGIGMAERLRACVKRMARSSEVRRKSAGP